MRAITASGTVPSTIMGSTRCDKAERNAPKSPSSSVSISRKPVTGSLKYCTAIRPDTGVHPSCTEKSRINSNPHQKIGIEYPVSEIPITP